MKPARDHARPGHEIGAAGDPAKQIVFVTLSLDVGGTERHLTALSSELVRRGWPVIIYCFNREGVLADQARAAGVRVIPPPVQAEGRRSVALRRLVTSLRAARGLRKLLEDEQPRIVHFFLTEPYIFGAPAARKAGVPIRIMSRREVTPEHGRLHLARRLEARIHGEMTAIIGNSRRVVDDLIGEGVKRERLGLIYSGVNLAAFANPPAALEVRRELGIAADALVLVKIANLIEYKGHVDLIAAIARLDRATRERLVVLLVGRDDGAQPALREQAASLGVADSLRFLGQRSDVPRLLAAADIGVHASHMEGFANAILEGMAAGLPVAATRVGGTPDAIIDGVTGLLVPPRDPAALAAAIERLAADSDLRRRMGAAARERINSAFGLAGCVDGYEALYRGLMAGRLPCEIRAVGLDQR
jgi:glycosyltransferase involved in cell wall biosynthesis